MFSGCLHEFLATLYNRCPELGSQVTEMVIILLFNQLHLFKDHNHVGFADELLVTDEPLLCWKDA